MYVISEWAQKIKFKHRHRRDANKVNVHEHIMPKDLFFIDIHTGLGLLE